VTHRGKISRTEVRRNVTRVERRTGQAATTPKRSLGRTRRNSREKRLTLSRQPLTTTQYEGTRESPKIAGFSTSVISEAPL